VTQWSHKLRSLSLFLNHSRILVNTLCSLKVSRALRGRGYQLCVAVALQRTRSPFLLLLSKISPSFFSLGPLLTHHKEFHQPKAWSYAGRRSLDPTPPLPPSSSPTQYKPIITSELLRLFPFSFWLDKKRPFSYASQFCSLCRNTISRDIEWSALAAAMAQVRNNHLRYLAYWLLTLTLFLIPCFLFFFGEKQKHHVIGVMISTP